MRPLNLQEFAEDMRRKGDIRDADLADEILALIDIEADVAEPYSTLCYDLEHYAPKLKDKPEKALEWLGDRSNLLEEIEKQLAESDALPKTGANGLPVHRDTDDAVKELLETLAAAQTILEENGWPGTDFLDALQGLAERAARAPEEAEVVEYDL